eukprot:scaffold12188_cov73-Isochrysis_galbana.AAC.1
MEPDLAREIEPDLATEVEPDLATEMEPDLAREIGPDLASEINVFDSAETGVGRGGAPAAAAVSAVGEREGGTDLAAGAGINPFDFTAEDAPPLVCDGGAPALSAVSAVDALFAGACGIAAAPGGGGGSAGDGSGSSGGRGSGGSGVGDGSCNPFADVWPPPAGNASKLGMGAGGGCGAAPASVLCSTNPFSVFEGSSGDVQAGLSRIPRGVGQRAGGTRRAGSNPFDDLDEAGREGGSGGAWRLGGGLPLWASGGGGGGNPFD